MDRLSLAILCLTGCSYSPGAGPQQQPGDGTPPPDDTTEPTDGPPPDSPQPLPILVDRGLVVRFFMDEAASGTAPGNLIDSAANPLPAFPITYGQASFIEVGGNRGLQWPAIGSGKAERNLTGKLASDLSPSRTVTIEVVAQIANGGTAGDGESQITGMRGSNPDFMLTAIGASNLHFRRPFGEDGATWANANNQQRMVLHLVYDSTQATEDNRINLFRNGAPVAKTASSPPDQFQQVGLGGGDALVVGNRQGADRSVQGMIFYVAYYDVALTPTEIANNAQRLIVDDDTP